MALITRLLWGALGYQHDYCSLRQGFAAFDMLKTHIHPLFNKHGVKEYSKKCMLNPLRYKYLEYIQENESPKSLKSTPQCELCKKSYKSLDLLELHFRLKHDEALQTSLLNENCPSWLCKYFPCQEVRDYTKQSVKAKKYTYSSAKETRAECLTLLKDCVFDSNIDNLDELYLDICEGKGIEIVEDQNNTIFWMLLTFGGIFIFFYYAIVGLTFFNFDDDIK